MPNQAEKMKQIMLFVKAHPESFASRTVIRRLYGTDYELNDEFMDHLENFIGDSEISRDEIDFCYDLIK